MKHHRIAIAAAIAIAIGASASAASAQPSNAADFGNAPSGEVPILFNDQHVYAKPDTLKSGRVLTALVRGRTILIPLRSMFEQMGASVSFDPATRTAIVSKPGSEVRVTVDRPEVVINGETRPLDVPPEMYHGALLVPVRILSEAMGAYVQWVADKRVVVVRFVPAALPAAPPAPPETAAPTAPPTPAPTAPATLPPPPPPPAQPAPTPAPVPAATGRHYESFIAGDYIARPNVYNQFAPGNNVATWGPSFAGRAAIEFPISRIPFMVEGYGEQYAYTHPGGSGIPQNTPCAGPLVGNPACVTPIGGRGSLWVRQFQAIDSDASARLGVQIAKPRIYLAGAYLWASNNYGYPRTNGAGFGLEKLPDLDRTFSFFGSAYYYPQVRGGFTDPTNGTAYDVQYRFLQYQAGMTYDLPFAFKAKNTGLFIEAGFMGNSTVNKQFLPGNGHESGAFGGIGIHF